ncbi:MAG: hypothetical protein QOI95_70 [Acidimicrobiaceae bacterium]
MIARLDPAPADVPADPDERQHLLDTSLASETVGWWHEHDGRWQIRVEEFEAWEYFVDPGVRAAAATLDTNLTAATLRHWRRRIGRCHLSMNDAWTLPAWCESLAGLQDDRPIVILHADDHDDLMPPRLRPANEGWLDLFTNQPVALDVESTTAAIRSSAIGMGSFLVPLLHDQRVVELRHLRARPHRYPDAGWLARTTTPEPLVSSSWRIAVEPSDRPTDLRFRRLVDPAEWVADLQGAIVLVHIDLDYLANRYDADSNWAEREDLFDPTDDEVTHLLDDLWSALDQIEDQVIGTAIGISPGFFPADHWPTALTSIEHRFRLHEVPDD